jgi:hypothetical protein
VLFVRFGILERIDDLAHEEYGKRDRRDDEHPVQRSKRPTSSRAWKVYPRDLGHLQTILRLVFHFVQRALGFPRENLTGLSVASALEAIPSPVFWFYHLLGASWPTRRASERRNGTQVACAQGKWALLVLVAAVVAAIGACWRP